MMNEQQMIKGCKDQDRNAQKALYEKYSRLILGLCMRYVSDFDAAQDLLQEGFIKVFSNIHTYQEKGSFEGWLKRIFINQALENIRKQKRLILDFEHIETLPDIADDPIDGDLYSIPEVELLNMIQELPKGYAAVFNLYAVEEYSHKEIGEILNISESTSRSQYVRARRLLQDKVSKYIKENS